MLYYSIAIILYIFILFPFNFCLYRSGTELNRNNYIGIKLYNLFFFICIVLGTLKWETGTDWESYLYFFSSNTTLNEYTSKGFEYGFALFNYVVHKISNSYTFYLLIYSSIIILLERHNLRVFAASLGLSIYLYYCTNLGDIFAVRQALALALCFFSIESIHNKKRIRFIIITLIAFFIHRSAAFWIFAYYIYWKKFNKLFIICLFSICLIIGVTGNTIFPKLIRTIILPFKNSGTLFLRVYNYTFDYTEIYTAGKLKLLVSIIKRLLFIPFFIIFRNRIIKSNKYVKGMLNLYFFGNAIYLLFCTSFVIFQRLIGYYCSLEIFLLPCLCKIFRKKSSKYVFIFLLFLYGLLKIYSQIKQFDVFIPYKTIFSNH